jgi:hypothetical protein
MYEDLMASPLIVAKVRESDIYAQHLYAAMCNNEFQRLDVMDILRDQRWSCSWRSAGGIVAEMRDCNEDYMDYYCSGIRPSTNLSDEEFAMLTMEQQIRYKESLAFVSESVVTDEIEEDLRGIGWIVLEQTEIDF